MNLFFIFFQIFNFQFQEGDLLFQDCDCGAMCDAIESVTIARDSRNYSHIAMVIIENDSLKTIEANINGVKTVPLIDFVNRYRNKKGKPTIAIGRLKNKYKHLIVKAIDYTISKKGMPYDTVFLLNNSSYYCSELLYEAFLSANEGKAFFNLYPMTFKDKNSDTYNMAFKAYYDDMKVEIPEGKLGLNPGSISRDKRLKMYYLY